MQNLYNTVANVLVPGLQIYVLYREPVIVL